ncbi:DUF3108 domain-containing protein [Cardinium endosymbiont of Nabis limbatus]|uniref:DUF3108 domain-containing protein n=1 Tax=Cardinium endosymbiont of Nabis limbatus TaxID=3066217 RepID=UPI003AF40A99
MLMAVAHYLKKFFFCFLTGVSLNSVHAKKAVGGAEPPFLQGESLTYGVYFSFIPAGTATMYVDKALHKVNEAVCYKVQVKGISNDKLALLGFKVSDTWESYLDADASNALRPHRCFTNIQENGYIRNEQIDFDHQLYQARVAVAESDKNIEEPEVTYHPLSGEKSVKDVISAYYGLRSIDTTKLKPGDKLVITVLHDRKIYEDVAILFLGKKTIKTQLGKISALVFAPLIPEEVGIFSGTRPVEVYVSDDANKVPLLLKVNLIVGSVEIKLTDYKGLKEPIHF